MVEKATGFFCNKEGVVMRIESLVGFLAIRTAPTANGDESYLTEPLLVLSARGNKVIASPVTQQGLEEYGTPVTLGKYMLDDNWVNYGDILNEACQTKAQLIRKLLTILGIACDDGDLLRLCKAVTFNQLLYEIADDLELRELLKLMEETGHIKVEKVDAPSGTTWKQLQSANTSVSVPSEHIGVVRRSRANGGIGYDY